MRLSTRAAFGLLAATAVPVADLLFALLVLSLLVFAPDLIPPTRLWLETWVVLHLAALAWTLVLVVVYWAYLFNTRDMAYPQKALWGLGLFWFSGLAMPTFWYLHIWQVPHQDKPPQ